MKDSSIMINFSSKDGWPVHRERAAPVKNGAPSMTPGKNAMTVSPRQQATEL
jgi:hypothetical protein